MNVIALILFIAAALVFLVAGLVTDRPRSAWLNTGIGACILTVGFIVQFLSTSHPVHF